MNLLETPVFDDGSKEIKLNNYIISYNNYISAKQTFEEIFNECPYEFKCEKEKPFIIDAGANIGIATFFFKSRYPNANILCFEPDPNAFKILENNITKNVLTDIKPVNAALAKDAGIIDFFGQIFVEDPDSRGNSIIEGWGLQRTISNVTKVAAVQLSSFINSEVDFLKLDIEGAEQQVLQELVDKLAFIKEMVIEVHESAMINQWNNLNAIIALLTQQNFEVNLTERNLNGIMPPQVREWVKKFNPKLTVIKAKRCL